VVRQRRRGENGTSCKDPGKKKWWVTLKGGKTLGVLNWGRDFHSRAIGVWEMHLFW